MSHVKLWCRIRFGRNVQYCTSRDCSCPFHVRRRREHCRFFYVSVRHTSRCMSGMSLNFLLRCYTPHRYYTISSWIYDLTVRRRTAYDMTYDMAWLVPEQRLKHLGPPDCQWLASRLEFARDSHTSSNPAQPKLQYTDIMISTKKPEVKLLIHESWPALSLRVVTIIHPSQPEGLAVSVFKLNLSQYNPNIHLHELHWPLKGDSNPLANGKEFKNHVCGPDGQDLELKFFRQNKIRKATIF